MLVQLCNRLGIPYFVIHDWDIGDPCLAITGESSDKDAAYEKLDKAEKAQYTKNVTILREAGANNVHHNEKEDSRRCVGHFNQREIGGQRI